MLQTNFSRFPKLPSQASVLPPGRRQTGDRRRKVVMLDEFDLEHGAGTCTRAANEPSRSLKFCNTRALLSNWKWVVQVYYDCIRQTGCAHVCKCAPPIGWRAYKADNRGRWLEKPYLTFRRGWKNYICCPDVVKRIGSYLGSVFPLFHASTIVFTTSRRSVDSSSGLYVSVG